MVFCLNAYSFSHGKISDIVDRSIKGSTVYTKIIQPLQNLNLNSSNSELIENNDNNLIVFKRFMDKYVVRPL